MKDLRSDLKVNTTKMKTLLGPGYYNPHYDSSERIGTSVVFERERTLTFDQKVIDEYVKETGTIKLDQAERKREGTIDNDANVQFDLQKKTKQEKMMASLTKSVNAGKQVEQRDSDMFIEQIKDKHNQAESKKTIKVSMALKKLQ